MDYVQNKYFDRGQALYAGQVAEWTGHLETGVRSYIREAIVLAGRGVVKGAVQNFLVDDHVTTPYAVKNPVVGVSVDADFVGIVVLQPGMQDDGNGNVGGVKTKGICTIAERGSGVIIGVNIPAALVIAHDDPVYLVLADGSFHNAAAAGRILLTGSKWYGGQTGPAAVTGVAQLVGRIKL